LKRGLLAGALRAGDFLLLVDYNFFEVLVAIFTNIFIDGQWSASRLAYKESITLDPPERVVDLKRRLQREAASTKERANQNGPEFGAVLVKGEYG
jgi:hypothetical protein